MAQIDSYRSSLMNRQNELSKLTADKAKEQIKIADLNKKINSASDAIRRTKTISTINSKLKEIERYNKDIANVTKKIADFESKIVKKNKEIFDYQKKINNEQNSIDKKRRIENDKLQKDQERSLRTINDTLNHHNTLHRTTFNEIQELKKIPEKITVLFLASNPIDQAPLRLDEEARSITEMIRKARHRDSVKFESRWALQTIDLLQAINEHDPTIVHFSGHGSDNDEIVFQSQDGVTKLVKKEALVQTMMASSDNIRLVFFNTCFSKNQAEAISQFVDATIGMNTSIGDEAARVFSSQFYSAISFGLSVEKAFQQAKGLLMMEDIPEESTPELFIKPGLKAEEIILVQPS
ncbi:CHAT domain-containing protein (plasmid) [Chryseobacterium panacisoli]|uniref:CHAT domain-containing protein n=1 Tax=Chryseobacterium panacisoli TaxID=1807141 RepID=A0A5D8ZUW6_9FLAO|nr:CHAT domain-containing protein [Chryseobacterium panacisoli]TZF98688.1 CHAT domain-containing protein [Chryseobacterium panacisoli]